LTDGKIGMASQCLGLAEALLGLVDKGTIVEKVILPKAPWKWLPARLWPSFIDCAGPGSDVIEMPWPDVVISCGRNAVGPTLAIKSRSSGATFIIHVQHPRVKISHYDLISAPIHDGLHGQNVIQVNGSMHRITPEMLKSASRQFSKIIDPLPHPRIAVLIGGSNSSYNMTAGNIRRIALDLVAINKQTGAGLMITTSRRTTAANSQLLRNAIGNIPNVFWDGKGENPYFAFLSAADAIIVTCDSVNMITEAAASGKPLLIAELDGQNRKLEAFHQSLYLQGIARPFKGYLEDWSYQPLNEPARVAREALRRIQEAQR
tara:strand:- start:2518 stop:3471 length:954 start_codon:yes stop_codon:yes gene_type:complete